MPTPRAHETESLDFTRQAWERPEVRKMAAGSAEDARGAAADLLNPS